MLELASKFGVNVEFKRLLLIILVTLLSATIEALLRVEEVRCLVPNVTQVVNAKLVSSIAKRYHNLTLFSWCTNLNIAYASLIEQFFKGLLMLVGHLNDNARIFGKEYAHKVVRLKLI